MIFPDEFFQKMFESFAFPGQFDADHIFPHVLQTEVTRNAFQSGLSDYHPD